MGEMTSTTNMGGFKMNMGRLFAERKSLVARLNEVYHTDPTEFSTHRSWKPGLNKKKTVMNSLKKQIKELNAQIDEAMALREYQETPTINPYFTREELADNSPELMGFSFDDPQRMWSLETKQYHREQAEWEDSEETAFTLPEKNWDHLTAEKEARIDLFNQLAASIKAAQHSTPRDLYKITQQVRKQLRILPWTKRGNKTTYNLALTKAQKTQLNELLDQAWEAMKAR